MCLKTKVRIKITRIKIKTRTERMEYERDSPSRSRLSLFCVDPELKEEILNTQSNFSTYPSAVTSEVEVNSRNCIRLKDPYRTRDNT
jgi:hypothetical protein